MEMFLFQFFFDTACGAIMFAVATGTTISCNLGKQYTSFINLSFSDVYGSLQKLVSLYPQFPPYPFLS